MNKLSCQAAHDGDQFDIKKCRAHRKANSYGMPLNYSFKCECCGKFTQKQQLTWNFSLIKIYYCGPQLVAYLITVKYLAILLFLLCLTNALPLLLINHKGKCCEKTLECSQSSMLYFSVFNIFDQHKKTAEENYVIFANFIVCLLFWHVLRNQLKKIKTQIDQTNFYPNQYAVFCQFPINNINKNEIVQSIEKWWRLEIKHNKPEIQKNFPKLLQLYQSNQNQRVQPQINRNSKQISKVQKKQTSQFIQQIIFSYSYPQFNNRDPFIKMQQLQLDQKEKSERVRNTSLRLNEPQPLQSATKNRFCLIIFKDKEYAEYFSKKNNPNLLEKLTCFQKFRYLYINKKQVTVTNQHYPSQILWENHHIQKSQKFKLFLMTSLIIALLIIVGSGLILLLCIVYEKYIEGSLSLLNQVYYVLVGLLINVMMIIGNKIITIYSEKQQHQTYVTAKASFVYKIVVFNISLILISPFIIFKCLNTDFLWKGNGFIETQVISLVIYMIAIQIERYLSPATIKIIRQHANFQSKQQNMNQKQANKFFTRPPHYIDQQYAAVTTIIIISFFLSTYAPFVTIFACIWMILQFWIEKLNISHFYNEDTFHSNLLSNKMVQLIEFSFSFLIFGNLSAHIIQIQYFHEKLEIQFIVLYTLLCAYCIFSIFLPHEKINAKVFQFLKSQDQSSIDQILNNRHYESIKDNFLMLYEDFNEVYLFHASMKNLSLNRMPINATDQVQSISASLSLSLKQKLMNNNEPIIKHSKEKDQENDEYFEYEKKINMKQSKPKINIPPLFQKNKTFKRSSGNIRQNTQNIA